MILCMNNYFKAKANGGTLWYQSRKRVGPTTFCYDIVISNGDRGSFHMHFHTFDNILFWPSVVTFYTFTWHYLGEGGSTIFIFLSLSIHVQSGAILVRVGPRFLFSYPSPSMYKVGPFFMVCLCHICIPMTMHVRTTFLLLIKCKVG